MQRLTTETAGGPRTLLLKVLRRAPSGQVGVGSKGAKPPSDGWFCPHCGQHSEPADLHCRSCGEALEPAAAEDPKQSNGGEAAANLTAGRTSPVEGPGAGEHGERRPSRRARLAAWVQGRKRAFSGYRHRKALIAVVVTVAIGLLAGGLLLIFLPSDPAPQQTQAALSSTASAVDDATGSVADANLLTDIRAVGRKAQASLADVAQQRRDITEISTTRYRTAATRLAISEEAYLGHLGALRGLKRSNLPRWYRIRSGLQQASGDIARAVPSVRELNLPNPAKALPSLTLLDHGFDSLDGV